MDKDFTKDCVEVRERLKGVEESTKSAHHRIDALDNQTQAIFDMSASIKIMAKQVEDMLKVLKEHDCKIDRLERLPAEKVYNYWQIAVGSLVSAGVGVVIGLFIK